MFILVSEPFLKSDRFTRSTPTPGEAEPQMAQEAAEVLALVNRKTGEVKELPRAPYAFDGQHINVGIRKGRELASADSGLTDREFRVAVWYWFATEEALGAIRRTQAEIAVELGMSADALGRVIKVLKSARILLEDGSVGRTKFYRCTPHLAFIGSGFEHREAVKTRNPPETNIRTPKPRTRQRRKKDES
ncbi:MarR family transcriptional regulator [Streptomyces sp. NPDC048659]|uniref:MarR family transcriptional regulator n=1 Tax=Streptomyces sp. NPDC048659 TaxID=3155489 RepID=UPI00342FA240